MSLSCNKCHQANWSTWISASTGRTHQYCKSCRQIRAKAYSKRKIISEGNHTKSQWLLKLEEYKGCPICKRLWSEIPKRPDKRYKHVWTKDHILPLIQGGSDFIDNIQPLCYQCNFGKR